MKLVIDWSRHLLHGGILAAVLIFALNSQAYYPFSGDISGYAYKVCHQQELPDSPFGVAGDSNRLVEICAYYNANGELLGYTQEYLN